jgi:phosphoribosylformimino-5-aminoimidazole carboxamide ribotide isomerase
VKQIVGGSLRDGEAGPQTNFVSERDAAWYADLYRKDGLTGAHVIQLGPGNQQAAVSALKAWPDGLQLGGGIHAGNAREWLEAGASKVIVTSALFDEQGMFQQSRLEEICAVTGSDRLVIDLSCRGSSGSWQVAIHRWQTLTDLRLSGELFEQLAPFCSEFLIHAADVEGLRAGMDEDLIRLLGTECPLPVTYAGGARSIDDLSLTQDLSQGRVDLTIGSALDIFGGEVCYADCVAWNQAQ